MARDVIDSPEELWKLYYKMVAENYDEIVLYPINCGMRGIQLTKDMSVDIKINKVYLTKEELRTILEGDFVIALKIEGEVEAVYMAGEKIDLDITLPIIFAGIDLEALLPVKGGYDL